MAYWNPPWRGFTLLHSVSSPDIAPLLGSGCATVSFFFLGACVEMSSRCHVWICGGFCGSLVAHPTISKEVRRASVAEGMLMTKSYNIHRHRTSEKGKGAAVPYPFPSLGPYCAERFSLVLYDADEASVLFRRHDYVDPPVAPGGFRRGSGGRRRRSKTCKPQRLPK